MPQATPHTAAAALTVILALPISESTSYFLADSSGSWSQCEAFCNARGGTLACPSTFSENEAAFGTCGKSWTGWSDIENEGTWKCVRGSVATYKPWESAQPDNAGSNEDCMNYHFSTSTWNDYVCDISLPCCCEPITEFFPKSSGTWSDCSTICTSEADSHHACPKNAVENAAAFAACGSPSWTGWSDVESEGVWKCTYGGLLATYAPWEAGQPDNAGSNEDCMNYHFGTSAWNDYVCSISLACCCSRSALDPSQMPTPGPTLKPNPEPTSIPSLLPTSEPTMRAITAISHSSVETPMVRTEILRADHIELRGVPLRSPSAGRRLLVEPDGEGDSDGGGGGGSRVARAAEVEAEVEAHLAASPFLKATLEALVRDLRREYQAELGVLRAELNELRAATRAE